MQTEAPIIGERVVNPKTAIIIKALPKREIKNFSPLVVAIGRSPFTFLVGTLASRTVRKTSERAINPKKIPVGKVQAIHSKLI